MAQIFFEGKLVSILEDRKINEPVFSNTQNTITESKIINVQITSEYHTYDDGLILYLAFDHSGAEEVIQPYLFNPQTGVRKKIFNVPYNCKVEFKRLTQNSLVIVVDERGNEEGYVLFATFNDKLNIKLIRVNYSKLLQYLIIADKYVLLNSYEKLTDTEKFHSIVLYNDKGIAIDTVFDEKKPLAEFYNIKYKHSDNKHIVTLHKSQAFQKKSELISTHTLNV